MAYDNTNSGALFKNNRRQKDTHPQFTGKLNVNGVDYYLNGWRKEPEGKEAFISLSVKKVEAKDGASTSTAAAASTAKQAQNLDDEIPF